jgi:hypothetical protein
MLKSCSIISLPIIITLISIPVRAWTVGKNRFSFDGKLYYADEVIRYPWQQVQIRVPLGKEDLIYMFNSEGKILFNAVYRDDRITVREKNKNELDKKEFVAAVHVGRQRQSRWYHGQFPH